MAHDEPGKSDDEFSDLLVEYHEELVSGRGNRTGCESEALDPSLKARLREAQQCVDVIEQLRRSARAPDGVGQWDLPLTCDPAAGGSEKTQVIGRFQILRELGRGGYGVVFLAHDPLLRRDVALKVPRPDALLTPGLRRRFLREAQAAARLTHPHLVAVHEVGEVGPICYIAAAYCQGPTLAAWLRERPSPVETRLAAQVVAELAGALHYAHTHGVLHRDLKPSNVLLEPPSAAADAAGDELPFVPKLTDFGLAKLSDVDAGDAPTRSGVMLGTPAYMAPEQADGRLSEVGPRTDVYALGALLYELLTGQPVFRGSTDMDTLHRVITDEPVRPRRLRPDVPPDLEAICLMCLEKDPLRRYHTAASLAADLRRFLTGEATAARPLSSVGKLWKWSRRRPATAALFAVSITAAATILGGSLWYSARLSTALVDTDRQRRIAEQAQHESERSHLATRAHEEVANQYLYASRMKLAYQGLAQGEVAQAVNLLREYDDDSRFAHLRGFEWRYAMRAAHEEHLTLAAHEQAYGVVFSPGGHVLATCGKDGTVMFWDPATGRGEPLPKKHESCVNQAVFSPDGYLLATASCDGSVKLWNVADRTEVPLAMKASGEVLCLAFSPDGRWLMAGGTNRPTVIMDVARRGEVGPLKTDTHSANRLAFSPDGKILAVADHEPDGRPSLSLWNVGTWQRRASLDVPASSVAFSPDSRTLAVGGFDWLVRLFDVEAAKETLTLRGHAAGVHCVVFSPDGKSLVSGSDDRTIRVWNRLEQWQTANALPDNVESVAHGTSNRGSRRVARVYAGHADRIQDVAFSPDGKALASASLDGTIKLWRLEPWGSDTPVLRVDTTSVREQSPTEFSPDLRYLAAIDTSERLGILEITNSQPKQGRGAEASYAGFALSPDGTMVAAIGASEPTITLCKFPSLDPLRTVPSHNALPGSIVLSNSAMRMATCCRDGYLRVRSLPDDREVYSVRAVKEGDPSAMLGVRLALSHDGRTLGVANVNAVQGIVDLTSSQIRPLPVGPHAATLMAFAPDDCLLAVAGDDRAVRLVDCETGKLVHTLWNTGQLHSLAFSPDGGTLAVSVIDGPVVLWHVVTGLQMASIEDFPGDVRTLRFSGDGASLAALVELPEKAGSELYLLSAATK